jgi:hypothetical protein
MACIAASARLSISELVFRVARYAAYITICTEIIEGEGLLKV